MAGLGTLLGRIAAAVAPAFFAWVTSLVRDWQAKRQAKKDQERVDKEVEESKQSGRPKWD